MLWNGKKKTKQNKTKLSKAHNWYMQDSLPTISNTVFGFAFKLTVGPAELINCNAFENYLSTDRKFGGVPLGFVFSLVFKNHTLFF